MSLRIRVGVHTGEVERRGEDLAGIAVNLTQQICAIAHPGEVVVSRTVIDLVAGSGLSFQDRGTHALAGVPGEWQLFNIADVP